MVSTENRTDLGYESPPGRRRTRCARRGGDRESQGTQINERSLRDHRPPTSGSASAPRPISGSRPAPQNLLTYRTLRVWMRGRGPGWEEGDLQAFLKLGSDNDNFYLYRAPAHSPRPGSPSSIIDLEVWRRLRADVENRWLSGAAAVGRGRVRHRRTRGAYVACEGPYLVHVRDPGINPPNLAAVQEISAGIYRVGETVTTADGRALGGRHPPERSGLGRPAPPCRSTPGSPPPTWATFTAAYIQQNGQFRQINQDPTYRGTDVLQLDGNLRLERFLPTSLGLAMPLTVTYARTGVNPELLTGTDIRGERAARAAEARLAEHHLRAGHPPQPAGDQLADQGPASTRCRSPASLTRGRALTELSEAKRQRVRARTSPTCCRCGGGASGCRWAGSRGVLPGFMREGRDRQEPRRAPT